MVVERRDVAIAVWFVWKRVAEWCLGRGRLDRHHNGVLLHLLVNFDPPLVALNKSNIKTRQVSNNGLS